MRRVVAFTPMLPKMFLLFICAVALSTTTAELTTDVTTEAVINEKIAQACNSETGFTYYKSTNSCYKLYKRGLPWVQGNAICTQNDSFLAILNDVNEAQIVSGILKEANVEHAWVGHRDRNSNGYWSSSHGDLPNELFDVWFQPKAHYLEYKSCGAIRPDVTLIDYSCLDAIYFVCEMPF